MLASKVLLITGMIGRMKMMFSWQKLLWVMISSGGFHIGIHYLSLISSNLFWWLISLALIVGGIAVWYFSSVMSRPVLGVYLFGVVVGLASGALQW